MAEEAEEAEGVGFWGSGRASLPGCEVRGGGATGAGGVKHALAGENEWSGEGSFEGSPPGSQDVVDLLLQLAAPAALLLQLLSQRLGVVLLLQFPQLLL